MAELLFDGDDVIAEQIEDLFPLMALVVLKLTFSPRRHGVTEKNFLYMAKPKVQKTTCSAFLFASVSPCLRGGNMDLQFSSFGSS